jgi:hypothetical protein
MSQTKTDKETIPPQTRAAVFEAAEVAVWTAVATPTMIIVKKPSFHSHHKLHRPVGWF